MECHITMRLNYRDIPRSIFKHESLRSPFQVGYTNDWGISGTFHIQRGENSDGAPDDANDLECELGFRKNFERARDCAEEIYPTGGWRYVERTETDS